MTQFIALCGYPRTGKTEVQKIISRIYGHVPVDDAAPLREATKILYGLTDWHVATQEGKSSLVNIGNRSLTVRKLLGDLGNHLEINDEFHLPRQALKTCLEQEPDGRFVFGSVRRNQTRFFKQTGSAIVIEITRQGCLPTGNFDFYNRDNIDISIENPHDDRHGTGMHGVDAQTELERRVRAALDPIAEPRST